MLHQEVSKPTHDRVHTAKTNGKPLSLSKMDREELEDYVKKAGEFTSGDELIRICECCILIAEV